MGNVLPPDNHVHTEWSWDAPTAASMRLSCEQALAAGIPAVAFTDHLDFTVPADGDRISAENIEPRPYAWMRSLDVTNYLAAVQECRQRYPILRVSYGKGPDGRQKIIIEDQCGEQRHKNRRAQTPACRHRQDGEQKGERSCGRVYVDEKVICEANEYDCGRRCGVRAKRLEDTGGHAPIVADLDNFRLC